MSHSTQPRKQQVQPSSQKWLLSSTLHPTQPSQTISIARLEAFGHNPIIPDNWVQYRIQSLYTPQDLTPYYSLVRILFPKTQSLLLTVYPATAYYSKILRLRADLESISTLVLFFGMTKARAEEVWEPYLVCRRLQILAALGLKMNVPNGVVWELVVEEKDLANREGMWGEVTAGVKWSGKVMGLREWVLGVFLPLILEQYGWLVSQKVLTNLRRRRSGSAWLRSGWMRITKIIGHRAYGNVYARQGGYFDRWIKIYWCKLWDSFASIDGKLRRGETIDL